MSLLFKFYGIGGCLAQGACGGLVDTDVLWLLIWGLWFCNWFMVGFGG